VLERELQAARTAVDDAVDVLREGRASQKPLHRIGKAAKDFLTEVDLASEAAIKRSLAAATPDVGFYGEEGGGAALDRGRVWVADPLDGTINYTVGAPTCGVMLGLLEDGVPVLGIIDLPFLGMHLEARSNMGVTLNGAPTHVTDVDALADGIVGMGDAFHRGGDRMTAFLELTMAVHREALRFRCVGAASVLWAWLAAGQIQGSILAHNNPYDVVAGHIVAQEAGALPTDYAGKPLTLDSPGAMACVPGVQRELLALGTGLAAAAATS
jgi:myo-inositol-1(or 4)-monophosphatase